MSLKTIWPVAFLILSLPGCAMSGMGTKGKASREVDTRRSQEIAEDEGRKFLPLVDIKAMPSSVELWRPTDKTSIWTPKGDAVFYAGEGAIIDFENKTVQYLTKAKSEEAELSSVMNLSDDVWVTWLETFSRINEVEHKSVEKKCSRAITDAQEHLLVKTAESRKYVLNYRAANCDAEFTDTLSLDRLFVWLENHGAPWAN